MAVWHKGQRWKIAQQEIVFDCFLTNVLDFKSSSALDLVCEIFWNMVFAKEPNNSYVLCPMPFRGLDKTQATISHTSIVKTIFGLTFWINNGFFKNVFISHIG